VLYVSFADNEALAHLSFSVRKTWIFLPVTLFRNLGISGKLLAALVVSQSVSLGLHKEMGPLRVKVSECVTGCKEPGCTRVGFSPVEDSGLGLPRGPGTDDCCFGQEDCLQLVSQGLAEPS